MTDSLQQLWHTDEGVEAFTDPARLAKRSTAFERTIRRRNLVEYAAAALLLCLEVPATIMFFAIGEPVMAGAMALMMCGTVFVAWSLYRRASSQAHRPEEDCRTHLQVQYRRQADALRTVPLWYIGPLLPGVLGIYGTVALEAIGKVDAWTVLAKLGGPLAATLAFFGFVIWLNLRAAQKLAAQAKALEEA